MNVRKTTPRWPGRWPGTTAWTAALILAALLTSPAVPLLAQEAPEPPPAPPASIARPPADPAGQADQAGQQAPAPGSEGETIQLVPIPEPDLTGLEPEAAAQLAETRTQLDALLLWLRGCGGVEH